MTLEGHRPKIRTYSCVTGTSSGDWSVLGATEDVDRLAFAAFWENLALFPNRVSWTLKLALAKGKQVECSVDALPRLTSPRPERRRSDKVGECSAAMLL